MMQAIMAHLTQYGGCYGYLFSGLCAWGAYRLSK